MKIYADGRRYNSKSALWDAVTIAAREVPPSVIKKLTRHMDSRIIEVIKRHGGHVGKENFSSHSIVNLLLLISYSIPE